MKILSRDEPSRNRGNVAALPFALLNLQWKLEALLNTRIRVDKRML